MTGHPRGHGEGHNDQGKPPPQVPESPTQHQRSRQPQQGEARPRKINRRPVISQMRQDVDLDRHIAKDRSQQGKPDGQSAAHDSPRTAEQAAKQTPDDQGRRQGHSEHHVKVLRSGRKADRVGKEPKKGVNQWLEHGAKAWKNPTPLSHGPQRILSAHFLPGTNKLTRAPCSCQPVVPASFCQALKI